MKNKWVRFAIEYVLIGLVVAIGENIGGFLGNLIGAFGLIAFIAALIVVLRKGKKLPKQLVNPLSWEREMGATEMQQIPNYPDNAPLVEDGFYKELEELNKKIKIASRTRDITPYNSPAAGFETITEELKFLIREQQKVLERKHNELSDWLKSIKKKTR